MSKINIQGTVDNIRGKSNVYTPLMEAIVNSIDSILSTNKKNGQIDVIVVRDNELPFEHALPAIKDVEIHDNGKGFDKVNRESFDTLYSATKRSVGGKGFGRFMYLKYFADVQVSSIYKDEKNGYFIRKFTFGRKDEIIVKESNVASPDKSSKTILYLKNLFKDKSFEKELETISRKLVEKLLIFFVDTKFSCPKITLSEPDSPNKLILNNYLKSDGAIKMVASKPFTLRNAQTGRKQSFEAKIFKIYYAKTGSKVILTSHNREVTETALHAYVPEFEDEFFDEDNSGENTVRKNYIIKTYVIGNYLDEHVSLERESFNFPKNASDDLYPFSQWDIEKKAAELVKEIFEEEVKLRSLKKQERINDYVTLQAPWHKQYLNKVDFADFSYTATDEEIELFLQKYKFDNEVSTKQELRFLLNANGKADFKTRLSAIMEKLTDTGKSDLIHYVCNRRLVLEIFEELRKRNEDGKANLETEIHTLIYPQNADSTSTGYEDHNLWLLDERLVFSEYIASDRKISKKKGDGDEPDILIFDKKTSFRNGENEFSNPLTIFEFKRPKRKEYGAEDDPVLQIGRYLEKIRQGKYEMPKGIEPIKVNDSTPVYAYVVCDLVEKVKEFARNHQLTQSPDSEGYFGYHSGFKMYIEIFSYKKLSKDASMRNKIFFKKLQLD